jgi:hypothetical protein
MSSIPAETLRRRGSRTGRDRDQIMQLQRLVDSRQRMKTISARRADIKAKIDFCVGSNRCRHTGLL